MLGMVDTGGTMVVGAGGGVVTLFASLFLMSVYSWASVSFVEQVVSTCLANCFSIAWNHLMSIVKVLTVFQVSFFGGGIRG
jgi:hypothetical protein